MARRGGRAPPRRRDRLLRPSGGVGRRQAGPCAARRSHPGTDPGASGGADQNITADQNEAFERALAEAGVEHELVVYEGAPHSFFDRKQEEFASASEDAWARVLDFIERHRR